LAEEVPPAEAPRRPTPPRETAYADEPRPRYREADEPEYAAQPPRYGADDRPGKVQAIAIMTLVGGILALLLALGMGVGSVGVCCLWPGTSYSLVLGILGIVRGSKLLSPEARWQPPPKGIAIMQIINIINFDIANCVLGILTLTFLNEPEVQRYFRGQGPAV
jgi:hypothetical protein